MSSSRLEEVEVEEVEEEEVVEEEVGVPGWSGRYS